MSDSIASTRAEGEGEGLPDERQLCVRAAGGDGVALQCLLQRHHAALHIYLARAVPSDLRRVVEAQDVLQDVLLHAFLSIRRFRPPENGSILPWLYGIARNRLAHAVCRHRAAKRCPGALAGLELDDESVVTLLEEAAVYRRTPSQSAIGHELVAALEQAIAELPIDYRQAVELRHLQGLAVKETAERMNRTEGAVQMLLQRALRALRGTLGAIASPAC